VGRKPVARSRTITRYSNRKLYDPAARSYVTLQELALLVARGEDVQVLDQRSGEDLTNLTLAQALLESVRTGASRIPRQALKQLIRLTSGPASGWGEWPEPEDSATRARYEAERLVARLLGAGRLSLDDAVALRHGLSEIVQRLVREAQTGVESRLRSLLSRGEAAAERSLGALRGRLEAYMETPSRDRSNRSRKRPAPSAPRARRGRSRK
jgi:polyhydroxyalkanoate synthesis repressor PhaR